MRACVRALPAQPPPRAWLPPCRKVVQEVDIPDLPQDLSKITSAVRGGLIEGKLLGMCVVGLAMCVCVGVKG